MATGISHHIGPGGDVEPCPIIQFATDTIRDQRGIYETLTELGVPQATSARPPPRRRAAASCWSGRTW